MTNFNISPFLALSKDIVSSQSLKGITISCPSRQLKSIKLIVDLRLSHSNSFYGLKALKA